MQFPNDDVIRGERSPKLHDPMWGSNCPLLWNRDLTSHIIWEAALMPPWPHPDDCQTISNNKLLQPKRDLKNEHLPWAKEIEEQNTVCQICLEPVTKPVPMQSYTPANHAQGHCPQMEKTGNSGSPWEHLAHSGRSQKNPEHHIKSWSPHADNPKTFGIIFWPERQWFVFLNYVPHIHIWHKNNTAFDKRDSQNWW